MSTSQIQVDGLFRDTPFMNLMTSALVPINSATVIPKKVDKALGAALIALYPNPSLKRPVREEDGKTTSPNGPAWDP